MFVMFRLVVSYLPLICKSCLVFLSLFEIPHVCIDDVPREDFVETLIVTVNKILLEISF